MRESIARTPGGRRSASSVQTQIHRMVKRIVSNYDPDQVILFGSHARGEAGPDSDVDLLIVMPVDGSVRERRLDIRAAVDIVVTRPEEFEWRKDVVGTIEWPAFREGKMLYVRP